MLLDNLFLKLPIEVGIQNERLTDYTGVYIFLDKEDNVLFDFYAYRCANYPDFPSEDEAQEVLKKWVNHSDVISYYEPIEGLYYSDIENERLVTIDYFIDNIYSEKSKNNSKESVYTKTLIPRSYFMVVLKRGLYYEPIEDIHKQLDKELQVLVETLDTAKELLAEIEQPIEKKVKEKLTGFEQLKEKRENKANLEKGKHRGFS